MKPLLITISIGLLLLIFVGALFIWGPLNRFLPERVQNSVQKTIPDVFKANRIGSFFGGNTDEDKRPVEDPNVPLGWQLKGQNGVIVVVTPFAPLDTTNATSSGTDGPKLPPIGDGTPPNSDFVLAGSAAAGDAYVISYYAADQSFTLTLLQEPIGESRKEGEKALLKALGITEAVACHLRYNVFVPWWINERFSGKNLGFSFCKGAPQF